MDKAHPNTTDPTSIEYGMIMWYHIKGNTMPANTNMPQSMLINAKATPSTEQLARATYF